MAQPVWVLSVDLQTKTATFQTGLADAARAARSSFSDIKGEAGEMGGAVNYSMTEARHSVMILAEEFGVHLPRALTSFIASLGPLGPALEAAFPFLAVALGATLLLEHLAKLREAGEELTDDQVKFGTAVNNAFNALNDKIIQAQIRADELRNDHLGALQLKLALIDHQSMEELVHSFDEVAKAADVAMKKLESHWYTIGKGSDGAKDALDNFQTQYSSLLSQGKSEQASGLLQGTAKQAAQVLQALKDKDAYDKTSEPDDMTYQKGIAAARVLQGIHVDTGLSLAAQIAAQQRLVNALNDQVVIESRVAEIKKIQVHNEKTEDAKAVGKTSLEAARKRAEEQEKLEREFAENVKQGNQDAINATEEGSTQRLDAIKHAMDETRALYGTGSQMYKEFANDYLKTEEKLDKQLADMAYESNEQEGKERDAAIKQGIDARQTAAQEQARHIAAMGKIQTPKASDDFGALRGQLQQEYAAKHAELQQELSDTQLMGTAKVAEQRRINEEIAALDKKHQDEMTENAAAQAQAGKVAALDVANSWGQSVLRVAQGHESMAKVAQGAFQSIISNSLTAMLMEVAHEKTAQLAHAEAAAAASWHAMSGIPVVGPALGAMAAAATFAGAMAFDKGGVVPGVGRGDVVPAMLSPGEGIVPGGVMEGLSNMARSGGFDSGGTHYHVHGVTFAPTVHALDSDGVDEVLTKHQDKFQRHFENTLKRMNR